MRIQDIIDDFVELFGNDQPKNQTTTVIAAHPTFTIDQPKDLSPLSRAGDDMRRLQQIVDLADNTGCETYGNEPKERYADIEAVTSHAGGGMNGPKNPSDIRGDHISLYPAHQHGFPGGINE